MKSLFKNKRVLLGLFALVVAVTFSNVLFGQAFNQFTNACASVPVIDTFKTFVAPASSGIYAVAGLTVLTDGKIEFKTKAPDELEKMEKEEYKKYVTSLMEFQSKNIAHLTKQAETAKEEAKATIEKQITELVKANNETLMETLKTQGLTIGKLQKELSGERKLNANEKTQINKFISDNADKIKGIKEAGSGMIEFTTKAPEDITTGSATLPVPAPALQGVQVAPPTNINLRTPIIDELITLFATGQASYAYTETIPKDGDYEFVAEGAVKPQIDLTIETRYAAPKKVAAHMILTDESVQDIPGMQSIANDYLAKRHALKRQDGILFGDGTGANLEGATVIARVFNAAGPLAATVPTPNIMDVINACVTDVFTTHNYNDEMPFIANTAVMNPIDFFTEFVAAKDGEGKPLYPQAVLFSRVIIGGITIIPYYKIPSGKIFVGDMAVYNVTNYIPYTVRIGFINDQFITNKFTIVGESRLHGFVKELDKQALIYDDIATIKAAILKV